jgi:hypothetical protein
MMVARNTFLSVENMPSVGNHEKLPYSEVHHLSLKPLFGGSVDFATHWSQFDFEGRFTVSIRSFKLIFSEDGVLLPDGIPHRPK